MSYQEMKKLFFKLKKIFSYEDPFFESRLHQLYLRCLQQAQSQPKLYAEAYILIKDLIQNMPKWYRIDAQNEAIPYVYVWRYA